jgi:plasmid stabilization system protein ParE
MKPVRFEEEAEAELLKAAIWYESRSSGLGRRFLSDVDRTRAAIARMPAFPRLKSVEVSGVQRALVHRFPYALVFLEHDDEIRILAVVHGTQPKKPIVSTQADRIDGDLTSPSPCCRICPSWHGPHSALDSFPTILRTKILRSISAL